MVLVLERKGWKMPLLRESRIQAAFIKRCNDTPNMLAFKLESPGKNGLPDVEVLATDKNGKGHCAFVEMKAPGKRPSKLQLHVMTELVRCGFVAFWSTDPVQAYELLLYGFKASGVEL